MSLIFPNSDYLKRIFNNASRRDWREDLKKGMIHFDLEKCNYYQKLQQCGLGNDLTENWHVAIYQQVMLKNSKKCIHVNCRSYLVLIYSDPSASAVSESADSGYAVIWGCPNWFWVCVLTAYPEFFGHFLCNMVCEF